MQEVTAEAKYTIGPNETCLTAMLDTAKARPFGVMFTRPKNYEWINVTSQEFVEEVFEVAKGLIQSGVEQGDRVALLSETRYEWSLLDFAIWAAGAVSVPIYGSSSLRQVEWIIEDSGAVFAITETREHSELMKNLVLGDDGHPPLKGSPSQLRRIVEINSSAISTLKFEGRDVPDSVVEERIANTSSSDLASLVYTSGTTGRPKGCCLTHYNWLSQVRGLLTNDIGAIAVPGNRVLTFLSASVDGWFTLPFTIPNYLANHLGEPRLAEDSAEAQEAVNRAKARIDKLMNIKGNDPHGPEFFHRQLGEILYFSCGVARNVEDLKTGIQKIRALRKEFWANLRITGAADEMNQVLEYASRVADYIDLGELMCVDALDRDESCGAHFRDDHLSEEGEAERDDDNWCFVSAWEPGAVEGEFIRHAEPLTFEAIPLMTRNYK